VKNISTICKKSKGNKCIFIPQFSGFERGVSRGILEMLSGDSGFTVIKTTSKKG